MGLLVLLLFAAVSFPGSASAQDSTRWVTDSFEVTMRTAKNNRAAITRMLRSGTRLELLETDREAGYSRVRTSSGAEGWVLSRYLLRNPPARVVLPDTEARLKESEDRRKVLDQENRTLSQERDELKRQIAKLENTGDSLQEDLESIREKSSNVLQIDAQNKSLVRKLAESERVVAELQAENQRLARRANREWFIIGAAVLVVGMFLGLILPRIRWRRKSSWGDF